MSDLVRLQDTERSAFHTCLNHRAIAPYRIRTGRGCQVLVSVHRRPSIRRQPYDSYRPPTPPEESHRHYRSTSFGFPCHEIQSSLLLLELIPIANSQEAA